jgi:amidase
MPGGRAALYTIKPTCGITSLRGVVPISDVIDSIGPMAKSVADLVSVLEVITIPESTCISDGSYPAAMKKSWSDLRVGVVEPSTWKWPHFIIKPDEGATKQMVSDLAMHSLVTLLINNQLRETDQAYAKIKGLAKEFYSNIELISSSELTLDSGPGEALWDFFGTLTNASRSLLQRLFS